MTIERMNKISAMKILLLFTMVLVFCPAMAQNELLQLLQAAEEANPNLEAGRKLKEAQQWEYRTGLTPSDPEIEFGFMPGNSDELGDKKIFSATQSLDFPSVYHYRNKLANSRSNKSEMDYRDFRQQLLLETQLTYYELVYQKKRDRYLTDRVQNTVKLHESLNQKMERGEATILEVNKARIQRIELENQLTLIKANEQQLVEKLTWLCGDSLPVLRQFSYREEILPGRDSLFSDIIRSRPDLLSAKARKNVAEEARKLAGARGLPKLIVGYESETVPGEQYGGPKVGISIPLWSNKNNVKRAKAQQEWAAVQYAGKVKQAGFELEHTYSQVESLQKSVKNYRKGLEEMSSMQLLNKSLQLGQISIINYVTEMNYYIGAYENFLSAEHDYYRALAVLMRYRL
ncbi:transporter [Prolixibacter bellariivorans]|uniref:Transporter n=2 Tax=Prolixibacter bellariivorans TaxID=314319 RepID=A0A5M4ATK6_9BACT|nr:TolC family protein [Prolixibacter bellariivorans]GET31212.1 transporter [Prolixibacter bellariivorans]